MKNFAAFLGILFMLMACDKNESETNLYEFCEIVPAGWECEIIEEKFDLSDIPRSLNDPLAIVKYKYPLEKITTIGESAIAPSLIINLYPISMKDELIKHVNSQQIFSWCIPILYGETKSHMVITSPCFINNGTFTEEANGKIEALHSSFDKILITTYYNKKR